MQPRKKVDVLISGNGPAGLAVAFEAMKAGKSVLMVSDRNDEYTRVQRVYINEYNRKYLLNFFSEDSILNAADEKLKFELIENISLQIKDIERFMMRRLDEFNKKTQLIEFFYQSCLDSIDCENGIATVDDQQIEYQYLIGADGSYHHAANLFNQSAKNNKIEYKAVESTEHRYHGNFYLLIKRKDGEVLNIPSEEYLMSVEQIEYQGETLNSLCYTLFGLSSYNQSDKKSIKCNFIGELPVSLYQLIKSNNSEAMSVTLPIIKQIISNIFEKNDVKNGELDISIVKPSQKYGQQKDKLKFIAFETEIIQANVAAVQEGKTTFILVGDAFRRPNYQIGHGLNDALFQASDVGFMFRIFSESSLEYYHNKCNNFDYRYGDFFSLLKSNKQEFAKKAKDGLAEDTLYLKKRGLLTFFKTLHLPEELQRLIRYCGLIGYIDSNFITQDQLLQLYKTKPWVVRALQYDNIFCGLRDEFVDLEKLIQLTEEQISIIVNENLNNENLDKAVESYIRNNKMESLTHFFSLKT